MNRKMPVSSPN